MSTRFSIQSKTCSERMRSISGLFTAHLFLRLSDKREIRDFAERNIPVNLLSLFNHHAKAFFADARILIVDLCHTVVSGRRDLSIDLQPLRDELNSSVAVTPNISVGLDTRLDDALDFIGLLL